MTTDALHLLVGIGFGVVIAALLVATFYQVVNAVKAPKQFWFCLAFEENGKRVSAYVGYPNNGITLARLRRARNATGLGGKAVLIGCSRLGYMTKEEFRGG
jgi:hypothetical protein